MKFSVGIQVARKVFQIVVKYLLKDTLYAQLIHL